MAVAHSSDQALLPGMTIGILGGGQLGRMLATAAAKLGFRCHIYCPDRRSPAFDVAAARTEAAYDDEGALAAFAASVDLITFEFENIPAATLHFLAERVAARPGPQSLELTQDRLAEKSLMAELGIPVAPFSAVDEMADIYSALAQTGRPAFLKTRRMGYDGKGQSQIRAGDDPRNAWRAIGEAPAILERRIDFRRELSVVIARSTSGDTAAFDPGTNVHRDGILHTTTVPSEVPETILARARDHTRRVADALGHVGVLAVEFFYLGGEGEDALLANEIAPRVHNSGHHTVEACRTSQFEQHIRAIAGWPLGDPSLHSAAVMTNLIGNDAAEWGKHVSDPASALTLYGKAEARSGRKMGHVTRTSPLNRGK